MPFALRPLCTLLLLVANAPLARARSTTPHPSSPQDSLPQRHRPVRGVLTLDVGPLRALRIAPEFTYVGGQRFILGGSADAEQHLFVVADSNRLVRRMYWVQVEELMPTQSGGYDYDADSALTFAGLPLRVNARRYTTPPTAGSDRARAFAFVEARGYRIPEGATRVRLIHLPAPRARQEIMIIHLEATPAPGAPTGEIDREAAVRRALEGLTFERD